MLRDIIVYEYGSQSEYEFVPELYSRFYSWETLVQGPGGGGAGAPPTGPKQGSVGGGGGGGGHSKAWGLIGDLPRVVPVVVGYPGRGGVGAETNESTRRGGDSKFGSFAQAQGGRGGGAGPASAIFQMRIGGSAGTGSRGYLNLVGQPGGTGIIAPGGGPSRGGQGGHSHLGSGARNPNLNQDGRDCTDPGGGGSGGNNNPNRPQTRTGGRGGPGIVIVKLYGPGLIPTQLNAARQILDSLV